MKLLFCIQDINVDIVISWRNAVINQTHATSQNDASIWTTNCNYTQKGRCLWLNKKSKITSCFNRY